MELSADRTSINQEADQPQDYEGDFIVLEALTPEEQAKLRQERLNQLTEFYTTNKQYQINYWYNTLKPFTFTSFPVQLTAIDAYVLYWLYYNNHDMSKMQIQHKQLFQYYLQLVSKVDTFLLDKRQHFLIDGRVECFMKLATRSPKDLGYKYSSHEIEQVANRLTDFLKQKHPQYQQIESQLPNELVNSIYRFFLQLSKQKYKIKNGYDFIQTFSSSQRIIIDISDFSFIKQDVFTQFQKSQFDRAQQPFIQLWARQWRDFEWYEELRCFYHDYQLTAITQYDQRCYFQELQNQQLLILKEFESYFNVLKPFLQKLELSQGVMDLVLFNLGKTQSPELKLIEINVFNQNSRGSLFSWEKDFDVLKGKILQNPQLRILTAPKQIYKDHVKRLMGMIEKGTNQIIFKALLNLGLELLWQRLE